MNRLAAFAIALVLGAALVAASLTGCSSAQNRAALATAGKIASTSADFVCAYRDLAGAVVGALVPPQDAAWVDVGKGGIQVACMAYDLAKQRHLVGVPSSGAP